MKESNDQDVFGIASAVFDYRSAAFRQKMFRYLQSGGQQHWISIKKPPARKKHESAMLHTESV